jgi:hypothetical protein
MSEIYFPTDHSADEWLAMAADSSRSSQESWERSDTDGFLSQWASDTTARMYRHLADLAENGGKTTLRWLFTQNDDGQWVPVEDWRWVQTRYGSSVLIPGEGYGNGTFFNPSEARKAARRQAADERKGYRWGTVEAEVVSHFSGTTFALGITDEVKRGTTVTVISTADYNDYD